MACKYPRYGVQISFALTDLLMSRFLLAALHLDSLKGKRTSVGVAAGQASGKEKSQRPTSRRYYGEDSNKKSFIGDEGGLLLERKSGDRTCKASQRHG